MAYINFNPILCQLGGCTLGQGIDLVNNKIATTGALIEGIPSIPAITPPGSPVTSPRSYVGQNYYVSSYSESDSIIAVEAQFSGVNNFISGSAATSALFTNDSSSLLISIYGLYTTCTGSYLMDENGTTENSWNPNNLTEENLEDLMAALNRAGTYDNFVDTNGTHFVGGVYFGTGYYPSVTATYASVQAQQAAAAAITAKYGTGTFEGSMSIEAFQDTNYTNVACNEGAFGWTPQPLPAGGNIDEILVVLNENLTNFPTASDGYLFYVLYDWRMIEQVNTWVVNQGNQPVYDQSAFIANLPAFLLANSNVPYISATAGTIQAVGDTSANSLNNYIADLTAYQDSLNDSTSINSVIEFAASPDFATWATGVIAIGSGQANFTFSLSLDASYDPDYIKTVSSPMPVMPTLLPENIITDPPPLPVTYDSILHTPHGDWNPGSNNNETWYFGYTYYPGQLVVSMGYVEDEAFVNNWYHSETFTLPPSGNGGSFTVTGVGPGKAKGGRPWLVTSVSLV